MLGTSWPNLEIETVLVVVPSFGHVIHVWYTASFRFGNGFFCLCLLKKDCYITRSRVFSIQFARDMATATPSPPCVTPFNPAAKFGAPFHMALTDPACICGLFSLILCVSVSLSLGADVPYLARLFVMEQFLSLLAFLMIALGVERLLVLVMSFSKEMYGLYLASTHYRMHVMSKFSMKRVQTPDGGCVFMAVPSHLLEECRSEVGTSTQECNADTSVSNPANEGASTPAESLQGGENDIKKSEDTPSSDACSAATTASD
jgi:hypothetical protein